VELCVLASGSGGNCSVIRTADEVFLVDCGIGPRTFAKRLDGTGATLSQVRSICLTHLDRDHFNPAWTATLIANQIQVFCPADRVHELMGFAADERLRPLVLPFKQHAFEPAPGVVATSLRMAHDRTGSHAFHFSSDFGSIGYATDLGRVPETLVDALLRRGCAGDRKQLRSAHATHQRPAAVSAKAHHRRWGASVELTGTLGGEIHFRSMFEKWKRVAAASGAAASQPRSAIARNW